MKSTDAILGLMGALRKIMADTETGLGNYRPLILEIVAAVEYQVLVPDLQKDSKTSLKTLRDRLGEVIELIQCPPSLSRSPPLPSSPPPPPPPLPLPSPQPQPQPQPQKAKRKRKAKKESVEVVEEKKKKEDQESFASAGGTLMTEQEIQELLNSIGTTGPVMSETAYD